MSVFAFSPTIYRPHFAVSPISNSSYHDRRRVTAQFKETEEAPTPNPKQEEEIKPLQAPAPSKILSPSIDIEIKKVVQKTAGTFAPRASTARKNPAVPGSTLYTIFEVQGYLSMVFGGALAFNLIFPSSEPDIWRLMGMWSIWMFSAVWNRLEPVGSVELAGTGMELAGSIRNQPKTVGYSRSDWLVLPNWTSSDNTDLSRARATRSWQKLLRVGSGILLIFSRSYNLFNRLYMAVLYISWYNRYFWAIQRPRRVH